MKNKTNILKKLTAERSQPHILFSDRDLDDIVAGNEDIETRVYKFLDASSSRDFAKEYFLSSELEKTLVVKIDSINVEAQNVLLKTLEDGSSKILFVFVLPVLTEILDTIKSRCNVVYDSACITSSLAKKYLSLTSQERIKMTDNIYTQEKENREDISLLKSFECYLDDSFNHLGGSDPNKLAIYMEISSIKKYMALNGYGKHMFYNLAFL